MHRHTAGWLGGALAALLVAVGCGIDDARPACAPGETACASTGPSTLIDPRIEGPGMRGDALPHWPMFHHDAQHTGRNGVAPPAAGALQWTFLAEGEIWSSPAIGLDGTVYFGSLDHKLYAVTPRGKLKWSFETLGPIFSSPAVAPDGTIVVGSADKSVYAVTPDGQLRWRFQGAAAMASSPAIAADGTVFIGSDDGMLYSIKNDGTLRWAYKTGGVVFSSPAIGPDGMVYVGSADGRLYAFR